LGIGSGIVKHLRDFTLGQVGVPDVHRCHRGEPGHGLPVGRHRRACRRAGVGLGEGEQAEVGQVRVAAELDLQTSRGRAFQVGRHDLGRTR
jgi:hypothetical protein